jgi:AhpD family alkylhydroperoxidase
MVKRLDDNATVSGTMRALSGAHACPQTQAEPPKYLADLAFRRASQINGCAFCIDKHSRDLPKGEMPVHELVLVPVWCETGDLFDERERGALARPEVVTRVTEDHVADGAYAAAAAVFSDKDLTDLTVAVAAMNAYNRLGVAYRLTPAAVA